MMMDRDKLNFWVRVFAILLSAIFLGSFIFMGIGTNVQYNLFDLIGGNNSQQQAPQDAGPEKQIEQARQNLEENPNDPEAIKTLAALYYQSGQPDKAAEVLREGREAAPNDPEIPLLLGQVYAQQAQSATEDRQQLYGKAGDAYAAATKIEPDNEQAYLLAGQAYDQAGQPSQAIKYWNEYLDRAPEGEQAQAVKERISALLQGGETTGGAQ